MELDPEGLHCSAETTGRLKPTRQQEELVDENSLSLYWRGYEPEATVSLSTVSVPTFWDSSISGPEDDDVEGRHEPILAHSFQPAASPK